jgi:RHS repeat-associated protein
VWPSWHGSILRNKQDGSGLEYMRNRVYDPKSGRFTQEDPIGLAGGLNLYGFADGDPITYSDPFGLCPQCLIGAVVGVGTGFAIAALTGADYELGDAAAAVDAALGAVGGGLIGKLDKLNDLRKGSRVLDGAADVVRGTPKQRRALVEHLDKLEKYKANPDAFDNKGFLKNAPSQQVREKIVRGRIKHLEDEIRAIRKAIDETGKSP